MKIPNCSRRTVLALMLALAAAPYFIGLGSSSLWDSNEAFYAETPRRMIETGDYLNPSFNDRPRFNKPPLSYWVVAASYKLFGVSEAAERLPIAIGAMVLIATAFMLGRASYTIEAGLFAALGMALSPRFLMFSRRIIIDIYLAMFMGLTLLFFVLAERESSRRRLYLALMYASAGLSFLTKGPVALALPAIVFLIYLIMTRGLGRLRQMMLPAGALIIAAIILPWYIAIYIEHGWGYIETFFLKDNLSRYTEPVWGPRRGILFYIPVLIGDMFPWSLFLVAGILMLARRAFRHKASDLSGLKEDGLSGQARIPFLLALWVAVIVLFFSFSSNKEDLYILPVYTAASALVGGLLSRYVFDRKWLGPSAVRWTTVALGLIISLGGAAVVYLFDRATAGYQIGGASVIGYMALAGGIISAGLAFVGKGFAGLSGTGITLLAINWVFVIWALPDFERYKPVRPFCEVIKREASTDAMVGYYRFASPSMVFYLGRPVFEYYDEEELKAALRSGKEVYCIMTFEDYEAIRGSLQGGTNILASNPIFQVKLRFILERREPTQVVLVNNRAGAGSLQ